MNRQEHMNWCKERALAYLPDDPKQAVMSMASDIRKHPETNSEATNILIGMMLFGGQLENAEAVRKFIQGFG